MKKIVYLVAFVAIVSFHSCDGYLDVNTNPNNPMDEHMTLAYRLPAAQYNTGYQETLQLNQLGSFWAGYWGVDLEGSSVYRKEQLYNGTAIKAKRDGIPIWENSYVYLNDYELLKTQADNQGARAYGAIARIMQTWHYMRLVDTYGDIPLHQALQGTSISRPKYDNGEQVYKESIKMLTEAIEMLSITPTPNEPMPSTDDIMFGGVVDEWIKFANTIKLRALLRQSETTNSQYVSDEIAKIVAQGGGFLDRAAEIQPVFNTSNPNPFWNTYYRNTSGKVTTAYGYIRPTQYILDQYEVANDPRLALLYAKTANGDYKGVVFGFASEEYKAANTSALLGPQENGGKQAGLLKSNAQAMMLMSRSESLFMQAEAAQRGWITESTQTLYESGIRASCQQTGVAESDIATYLTEQTVIFNNTLDQIILQKWLSLNSISGFEAWSDFRRLGLPAIPNSHGSPANEYPHRLMYPETEEQTNIVEVEKREIKSITESRVWWEVN